MKKNVSIKEERGRVKESLISLGVILCGILGIVVITIVTPHLEEKYEQNSELPKQEVVEIIEDEMSLEIDTEELFEFQGITLEEDERLRELINILPEANAVEEVMSSLG